MIEPGAQVGSYRIVKQIDSGGMGDVWEAFHVDLQKRVAIKTLKSELLSRPEVTERFLREARAASAIHHDNVVSVTDVGVASGEPYMVMEFLAGESLAERLERVGTLSAKQTVGIALPILAALAHTHDENVIHRDLKPGNIFLQSFENAREKPVLLDFGISKVAEPERASGERLSLVDAFLGTPQYVSPEQAANASDVDVRADLFSIGVVLYECLAGRVPYEGSSPIEVIVAINAESCPRLDQIAPECPSDLADAIHRAIRRDPNDRYASAREFGEALLPWASSSVRARYGETFGVDLSYVMRISPETGRMKAIEETLQKVSVASPKRPSVLPFVAIAVATVVAIVSALLLLR